MIYANKALVVLALVRASSCSATDTRDGGSRRSRRALKSDKKSQKVGKIGKKTKIPTDLTSPVTEFEFSPSEDYCKVVCNPTGNCSDTGICSPTLNCEEICYYPDEACDISSQNSDQWASQTGLQILSLTTPEPNAFCLVVGGDGDLEETFRKRVLDSCAFETAPDDDLFGLGPQWQIACSDCACGDRECSDCDTSVLPLKTLHPKLAVGMDFAEGQFCFPVRLGIGSVFRHVAAPDGNAEEYWRILASNSCLDPFDGGGGRL